MRLPETHGGTRATLLISPATLKGALLSIWGTVTSVLWSVATYGADIQSGLSVLQDRITTIIRSQFQYFTLLARGTINVPHIKKQTHVYWWPCRPAWIARYVRIWWKKPNKITKKECKKMIWKSIHVHRVPKNCTTPVAWRYVICFSQCVPSSMMFYLLTLSATMVYCTLRSCCLRIK